MWDVSDPIWQTFSPCKAACYTACGESILLSPNSVLWMLVFKKKNLGLQFFLVTNEIEFLSFFFIDFTWRQLWVMIFFFFKLLLMLFYSLCWTRISYNQTVKHLKQDGLMRLCSYLIWWHCYYHLIYSSSAVSTFCVHTCLCSPFNLSKLWMYK